MNQVIKEAFESNGFSLSEQQIHQFAQYHEILVEWNQKMNLTAIEQPREVAYKHFVDSALLLRMVPLLQGLSMIDIGTGAGFPGIPLKIMEDQLTLCLFDSLNKRINFLRHVCDSLQLRQVETVHGRAEEFGQNKKFRQQYDLATARAVARLPVLLELCLPFVKVGGKFIALKGPELINEIEESQKALTVLGGKIIAQQQFSLDHGQYTRNIVVIEKIAETPKQYPRKAGTPQKNPLGINVTQK